MELTEAVREIPDDGAEIALGGFAITRNPIAFVNEIIRQKKKNLTLYEIIGSMDADLLVGAGCVSSLSYAGGSLDRFGRIGRINEAIEKNKINVEEFSGLSMSLRFLAVSLGMPFVPTKTLLGTDMLNNLLKKKSDAIKVMDSPFSNNDRIVLLKAINPEFAVIHAQIADEKGNVIIEGPRWDIELALSAKKLFVTVEQIVSNKYIKKFPEKVSIPSISTYKVIEVPYGAFPTSAYNYYDYCSKLLQEYAKVNLDSVQFDEFLQKYIVHSRDHADFLLKTCTLKELFELRVDPEYGYPKRLGGKQNE
jgi:acyl CoA:acetate/3-ketoacid CoA transferase alpha subunit